MLDDIIADIPTPDEPVIGAVGNPHGEMTGDARKLADKVS